MDQVLKVHGQPVLPVIKQSHNVSLWVKLQTGQTEVHNPTYVYTTPTLAISNLYDFTFCNIKNLNAKTHNKDVFICWSQENPDIALPNKICLSKSSKDFESYASTIYLT